MKRSLRTTAIALIIFSSLPNYSMPGCSSIAPNTTFSDLVKKSASFNSKTPFPTQANKIATIANDDVSKQTTITQQANTAKPIISAKVIELINEFLAHKKEFGSAIEKALYATLDTASFIDRLLIKRPLMFMNNSDDYILRDGSSGHGGFEAIGTPQEKAPLILQDYLSYDEMQISALLGVSAPTYFINNGDRNNKAKQGRPETYEEEGVYVGLVGTRFEKPGLMEWQHMIITQQQNTHENGYGPQADPTNPTTKKLDMWSTLYGQKLPTFKQVMQDTQSSNPSGRYIDLGQQTYLNSDVYKERMRMVIEPFLVDANERGINQGKKVYCHAVGLGLGVWQKSPLQTKLMLEVYADILKNRTLSNIADLDFSWFDDRYKTDVAVGNNTINIHFSKRNPADKLVGPDAGKLLVAMYAWDGNSYPGNEYWAGDLTGSGDPAAACCSTIAELQNPLINSNVSAKKLFVVD